MHDKKIEEVFKILNTNENGLAISEIEDRKRKYGINKIQKEKKKSFFAHFLEQFKNLMVIILLFSALISIIIAVTQKEAYELVEGLIILFIVILNAFIGVIQENKAQACLEELEKKTALHTHVIRNGKQEKILAEELVVGDIVYLSAGDVVPADIRLIETKNLSCDDSSLTGESVPSEKNADVILDKNTSLLERINIIYNGSLVCTGHAKGVVISVGDKTEIGKITKLLKHTKKDLTPLEKTIKKLGKIITYSVLAVCLLIFILELFFVENANFITALMTSVALAVAAIPESLPAVITLIMAMGVQQLAKRKVIIKQLHAVETLGCCEIICSDKTGTLTKNKMEVREKYLLNKDTNNQSFKHYVNCMYLCNSFVLNNNSIFTNPTEKALYDYALPLFNNNDYKKIDEIPFDSTRKMMSTIYTIDGKMYVYSKGSIDTLLNKCNQCLNGNQIIHMNAELRQTIIKNNDSMASKALRVLCLAFKPYEENKDIENNLIFLGLVGMRDEPRQETKSAIKKCFQAGLKPIMITGDHKLTAFSIAKELGISKNIKEVLTGEEINAMPEKDFVKNINNWTVFARVSPEHKVRIVSALKHYKKVVAMTGDGVNDAPSLKIADIGVGMGQSGTEVVKSVADMVLTDDNFNSIVVAVEEGRKVYNNIQKALQYLISTNVVEILGMLFALIFYPSCVFLIPAQMLFINLVTDSLPAFALGVEKAENDVMKRPPRKSKEGLFSNEVGFAIIYQGLLQTCLVIMVFGMSVRFFSPEVANTMTFFTIAWQQLFHSINCKTNESLIGKNIFNNKLYNICFLVTLAINILVCTMPIFYTLFDLTRLNLYQIIWVAIVSISIIPLCEIIKFISYPTLNKNKIRINQAKYK